MSTPRENRAIEEICGLLTDTQTVFPGTDMRLIYKSATLLNDDGSGVLTSKSDIKKIEASSSAFKLVTRKSRLAAALSNPSQRNRG